MTAFIWHIWIGRKDKCCISVVSVSLPKYFCWWEKYSGWLENYFGSWERYSVWWEISAVLEFVLPIFVASYVCSSYVCASYICSFLGPVLPVKWGGTVFIQTIQHVLCTFCITSITYICTHCTSGVCRHRAGNADRSLCFCTLNSHLTVKHLKHPGATFFLLKMSTCKFHQARERWSLWLSFSQKTQG